VRTEAGVVVALLLGSGLARAGDALDRLELERINRRLCGVLVDHTAHHGQDGRIWSAALCQKRNLYVYLPPHFDPSRKYPLLIYLHANSQDEKSFARREAKDFDEAIVGGQLPPMIVACPSGTIPGQRIGSLFLNHKLGCYEDYIIHDVWPFLCDCYPIDPDRRRHAIMGMSSGGWAAYTLALRHRHLFGVAIGIIPVLNWRWLDCHGRYRANFDPCCWGWRNEFQRNSLIGLYYGMPVTFKQALKPFFGWGDEAIGRLSQENPIELLDRYDIQPGDLALHISYIRRDQLNADAQVESFLCVAAQRGIPVTVEYRPRGGGHNFWTGRAFFPKIFDWLGPVLTAPAAADDELAPPPRPVE
jgi:hypothetical protein